MSSLHDFVHHKLGEDPGRQNFRAHLPHDAPQQEGPMPPVQGTISCNRKANEARFEGALKGDLAYSRQESVPTRRGNVETDQTVIDKVVEKEIFPLG